MRVDGITPILNVSDLRASLDWFEALGWRTGFVWGEPDPGFASVVCGDPKGRGEILRDPDGHTFRIGCESSR
jgi:catechol 2,3-dioxygenase-like lactoylglutathione lyase family enzyme